MSGEAIGIMDGAFFVGRGELLAWINDFLSVGFINHSSLTAEFEQGRAVRHWSCLLLDTRRHISRYSCNWQSEVERQTRIRIR